ncbi:hypothetical protein SAMN02745121_07684 [Nannocystis exedens]|uniref:Uncharacterized protein n=2 Tax=Nannocystis exedens TaxID=54 RepID=A0A1I2H3X9_9BACT|nr:hypothetical protein [Nannocystis exedens]PCC74029.1 hypothetical protein NAEX_07118 [Nannocystis exedens]SFF24382.1 hypothetical protein SAMN02745121_07684 [Nannocystis exedens]
MPGCSEKSDGETDGSETTGTATTATQPTEDATTTGSAATTASESETGASVGRCECGEGDPCAAPLCETVVYVDSDEPEEDEGELAANLRCALEALRDRKVGTLRWSYQTGDGQIDEHGHYQMFGDGTALYTHGGVIDLCEWVVDRVTLVTMQSPAVFSECLAMPAPGDQFSCLQLAPGPDEESCIEGEKDCGG